MQNFKPFVQLCTRSLGDDPALRLEVEQELETHLEDACAEEQSQGKNATEAEENARQRFGDPETLAQSLLDANRRRLKLRARIRLLIKLALIPTILLGLALCIDLRTLAGISQLLSIGSFFPSPNSWQENVYLAAIARDISHLNEEDQEFVQNFLQLWTSGKKSQWEKKRYEKNPDSKVFTASYAVSLIPSEENPGTDKDRDLYLRILEHGRRIDPDNALYDYLEADLIMLSALRWEKTEQHTGSKKKTDWNYIVEDRAALDRGMELYLAALKKPFVNAYSMEVPAEARRLLNPQKDFLGLLERISIDATTPLNFLNRTRGLSRKSIAYGEILLKEGKTAEAEKYLHSWRKFIPQQQKYNANTLIEVLVYYANISAYLDSALERGDTAEAEKLNRIRAIAQTWKEKKDSNNDNIRNHGGILSGMLLPALKEKIPLQELEPERKLTYLVSDLAALALLSLLLMLLIVLFGIGALLSRAAGHRPFLLLLPLKSYRKVLLFGVLIPIGIFLLYTHIDLFGGRDLSIQRNLLRWGLGVAGIVFIFPFVFSQLFLRELKKQGEKLGFKRGKLPFATACLNMLCASAALLLVTGCALRPLLAWECRYCLEQDRLINTAKGFTQPENQVTDELNRKLADAIAKADQEP